MTHTKNGTQDLARRRESPDRACSPAVFFLALMVAAMLPGTPAGAVEPCCGITAIDAKTQTVTASETSTRRTFQFKVADTKVLTSLKVGQPVHADFKTMKVSLNPDGIAPCCNLVNLRAPATTPVR
jgi:hypothetical protein